MFSYSFIIPYIILFYRIKLIKKISLLNICKISAGGIILLVLFSFFGNIFFLSDLVSHFYGQYFFGFLFFLGILLWKKEYIWSGGIILGILYTGFFFFQNSWQTYSGEKVEYYFMNTLYTNTDIKPIIKDISEKNPDHIAMVEVNIFLKEKIQELGYFPIIYRDETFKSVAFFTKFPEKFSGSTVKYLYPFLHIKNNTDDIYIIHPFPPFTPENYKKQKEFFSFLREYISISHDPKKRLLIMGDFNSTYYSQVFQKNFWDLFYMPIYSWNIHHPLMIPIDYIMSNTPIKIIGWKKLSSDHIPLLLIQE